MTVPTGTVVVVGHPANGLTATKQADGTWRANIGGHVVPTEDVAYMGRTIYVPGEGA